MLKGVHPVAEAGLAEDVGGMVSVVAQLAPELLRRSAHPLQVAGSSPCRYSVDTQPGFMITGSSRSPTTPSPDTCQTPLLNSFERSIGRYKPAAIRGRTTPGQR